MAVDPKSLTDPKLIRALLKNAQKAGRNDLVLQCQVRLAELEGQKYSTQIEREFWSAVCCQGFDILVEGGHPELTGEAIVVRHATELSQEAVAAARQRLVASGVDISKV